MIVGETKLFEITIEGDREFAVENASVQFVNNKGESRNLTAIIDNPETHNNHTISAFLATTADDAGHCSLVWTVTAKDIETNQNEIEVIRKPLFISHNDVFKIITDRIQTDIDEDLLNLIVVQTNNSIIRKFENCLANYYTISSEYRFYYDLALAYLCINILRGFVPNTSPTTELISVQIGTDVYKYAQPLKPTLSSDDRLIAEAYDMLTNIPCIDTMWDGVINNTPLLKLGGNRRFAGEEFKIDTTKNYLYDIYVDVRRSLNWNL